MKYLSVIVLVAAATVLAGCQTAGTTSVNNPPAAASPPVVNATPVVVGVTPGDDVARISVADAKAAFDAGTALFVDSRAEAAYKAEHIKGAINVPGGTLDAKIKSLPNDKKIIVYCS